MLPNKASVCPQKWKPLSEVCGVSAIDQSGPGQASTGLPVIGCVCRIDACEASQHVCLDNFEEIMAVAAQTRRPNGDE